MEIWRLLLGFYVGGLPMVWVFLVVRDNASNNHSLSDMAVITIFWPILLPIVLVFERGS